MPLPNLLLPLCAASLTASACAQSIVFVDHSAPPGGDGTAWTSAFADLQDGLLAAAAQTPAEIWVAAGVYLPDRGTRNRAMRFTLAGGVAILGGFDGSETLATQRDSDTNITILSGDLRSNDGPNFANYGDNSFHVVVAAGVDATAILDGVTIRGGNANNLGGDDSVGGGFSATAGAAPHMRCIIFEQNRANFGGGAACFSSSPAFEDCTFRENIALTTAGGVFAYDASAPHFVRCRFEKNAAALQAGALACALNSPAIVVSAWFGGNSATGFGGGAVLNNTSNAIFVNCVFTGNTSQSAIHGGGAMRNEGCNPLIANCALSRNTASTGGGIFNFNSSVPTIANSILWGNLAATGTPQSAQIDFDGPPPAISYSLVEGWTGSLGGVANAGNDPLLIDSDGPDNVAGTNDDDLRLSPGSPAIDSGANAALPPDFADLDNDGDTTERTPLDLAGNPRFLDDPGRPDSGAGAAPLADRGAYEFTGTSPIECLADLDHDLDVDIADLALLLSRFGTPAGAAYEDGDLDADDDVDIADLAILLSRFGTVCN